MSAPKKPHTVTRPATMPPHSSPLNSESHPCWRMPLEDLPPELLQKVAYSSNILDAGDILALILTCKQVHHKLRGTPVADALHYATKGVAWCARAKEWRAARFALEAGRTAASCPVLSRGEDDEGWVQTGVKEHDLDLVLLAVFGSAVSASREPGVDPTACISLCRTLLSHPDFPINARLSSRVHSADSLFDPFRNSSGRGLFGRGGVRASDPLVATVVASSGSPALFSLLISRLIESNLPVEENDLVAAASAVAGTPEMEEVFRTLDPTGSILDHQIAIHNIQSASSPDAAVEALDAYFATPSAALDRVLVNKIVARAELPILEAALAHPSAAALSSTFFVVALPTCDYDTIADFKALFDVLNSHPLISSNPDALTTLHHRGYEAGLEYDDSPFMVRCIPHADLDSYECLLLLPRPSISHEVFAAALAHTTGADDPGFVVDAIHRMFRLDDPETVLARISLLLDSSDPDQVAEELASEPMLRANIVRRAPQDALDLLLSTLIYDGKPVLLNEAVAEARSPSAISKLTPHLDADTWLDLAPLDALPILLETGVVPDTSAIDERVYQALSEKELDVQLGTLAWALARPSADPLVLLCAAARIDVEDAAGADELFAFTRSFLAHPALDGFVEATPGAVVIQVLKKARLGAVVVLAPLLTADPRFAVTSDTIQNLTFSIYSEAVAHCFLDAFEAGREGERTAFNGLIRLAVERGWTDLTARLLAGPYVNFEASPVPRRVSQSSMDAVALLAADPRLTDEAASALVAAVLDINSLHSSKKSVLAPFDAPLLALLGRPNVKVNLTGHRIRNLCSMTPSVLDMVVTNQGAEIAERFETVLCEARGGNNPHVFRALLDMDGVDPMIEQGALIWNAEFASNLAVLLTHPGVDVCVGKNRLAHRLLFAPEEYAMEEEFAMLELLRDDGRIFSSPSRPVTREAVDAALAERRPLVVQARASREADEAQLEQKGITLSRFGSGRTTDWWHEWQPPSTSHA